MCWEREKIVVPTRSYLVPSKVHRAKEYTQLHLPSLERRESSEWFELEPACHAYFRDRGGRERLEAVYLDIWRNPAVIRVVSTPSAYPVHSDADWTRFMFLDARLGRTCKSASLLSKRKAPGSTSVTSRPDAKCCVPAAIQGPLEQWQVVYRAADT